MPGIPYGVASLCGPARCGSLLAASSLLLASFPDLGRSLQPIPIAVLTAFMAMEGVK